MLCGCMLHSGVLTLHVQYVRLALQHGQRAANLALKPLAIGHTLGSSIRDKA